jgi:hypothetical protein
MKAEFRHKLAQLPFEEKIRRVDELIRLSRKVKTRRVRERAASYAPSATDNSQSTALPLKISKK